MDNKDIVITSAFRTAISSLDGGLSEYSASELGSFVIKKCMEHSNLQKDDIDYKNLLIHQRSLNL